MTNKFTQKEVVIELNDNLNKAIYHLNEARFFCALSNDEKHINNYVNLYEMHKALQLIFMKS